jgi:hypothetical protein
MTNQDEFLKKIRKEHNTNETTYIEILDIKNITMSEEIDNLDKDHTYSFIIKI